MIRNETGLARGAAKCSIVGDPAAAGKSHNIVHGVVKCRIATNPAGAVLIKWVGNNKKIWRPYFLARYTAYCQSKWSRCFCTVASQPETWRHCLCATYRKTQQTRTIPLESCGGGQRWSPRGTSGNLIITIVILAGQWNQCSVPAFLPKAKGDISRTRMQITGRHQETEEQRCVVVLLVL